MLFNSIEFAIFASSVFVIYWFLFNKNHKSQNALLLISSWVFYAWWDWRFLLLLVGVSVINYLIAIRISSTSSNYGRKNWFILGLVINLANLIFFKYNNFFIDGFIDLAASFGYNLHLSGTKVILPLGISFYTFISLSYLIDVHKKTINANNDIVEVLLSISFFPIILAGPIQRPTSVFSQFSVKRIFSYDMITCGMRQILWGLFVKVVIADNLAIYADDIFDNYSHYNGITLFFGLIFYSVQIYADFSGYSNIAIGSGKLFGLNLIQNFNYPYFSRNIAEFWKRWHISLTQWFRDYVFLPLSFSISWKLKNERVFYIKADLFIYIAASIVTWILTGLWHGANYTFLIWGLLHGFYLIIFRIQIKPRKRLFNKLGINNNSGILIFIESIITFFLISLAWVFFRSPTVEDGVNYLILMFSGAYFALPEIAYSRLVLLIITILTLAFFSVEWFGRNMEFAIAGLKTKTHVVVRWMFYYCVLVIIFFFAGLSQKFIYFQF
jgi:D-alanyl-lipoteichoic acid acyltransferase DltB (MBOAT superfamily)